jgi:formate dehydrogenase subunit delta
MGTPGTPPAMRLATEIAAQFRHVPPEEAAHTIARHIHTFWDPRMRTQLKDQVAQAGEDCDDLVAAAAGLIDDEPAELLGE